MKPKRLAPPIFDTVQSIAANDMNISIEADYMVNRARECHGCVVTLGPLLLFSTHSGDAWLLDPSDGLALCMVEKGERLPFTIIDSSTAYSIEWTATYRISGHEFIVQERSGHIRGIFGYPIVEILEACKHLQKPQ